jgi:hypothetical protein
MEKADTAKVEQDAMDELRLQEEWAQQEEEWAQQEEEWAQQEEEWAQQEEEWAAKEVELDEKEAEYIRQVNVKEINEDQFWELVVELDLERVMGESIMEGPATRQGDRGERVR